MYTGCALPDSDGLARYGQDKVNRIREGSYKTVSQTPAVAQ